MPSGRWRERGLRQLGFASTEGMIRRRGRLVRAVNDLAELLDATRQIAAQTRQRLAGRTPPGAPPGGSACTTATPDPREAVPGPWAAAVNSEFGVA
jgi:hypothetical protein